MALLSLDRHDVLESIRQSKDLHDAFLRVAKLIAYDAEVVVRCRDCIHRSGITTDGTFFRCDRYDKWQDESNRVYMPLDGFCSYGQMEGKDADEEEKN